MKIASFKTKDFAARWAVLTPATLRYLHPVEKSTGQNTSEFEGATGTLHSGVKIVTECRLVDLKTNQEFVGFTGCSRGDTFNLFHGIKTSLAKSFENLKVNEPTLKTEKARKALQKKTKARNELFYKELLSDSAIGDDVKFSATGSSASTPLHKDVVNKLTTLVESVGQGAY